MQLTDQFPLLPGSHPTRGDGLCAMEMVAWLAGEEHSDGPRCTCPVIATFVRAYNDFLPDVTARDRYLRPLLPRLINTVGTRRDQWRRGYLAADWAVRVFTPMALQARGELELAATLRALPCIRGPRSAEAAAAALPPQAPRAVSWIVAHAATGNPPTTWVAAAAHAVRNAGTEQAWSAAARLIEAMVALGAVAPQRSVGVR